MAKPTTTDMANAISEKKIRAAMKLLASVPEATRTAIATTQSADEKNATDAERYAKLFGSALRADKHPVNVQALLIVVRGYDAETRTIATKHVRGNGHTAGSNDKRDTMDIFNAAGVTAFRIGKTPLSAGEVIEHAKENSADATEIMLSAARVAKLAKPETTAAQLVGYSESAARIILGQAAKKIAEAIRPMIAVRIGGKWKPIETITNA